MLQNYDIDACKEELCVIDTDIWTQKDKYDSLLKYITEWMVSDVSLE